MEIHSASIKSIVFAGATHRELDGKKKKKGKKAEKGGKKHFCTNRVILFWEYQRKGHSIHPLSCYCSQQEDAVNVHAFVYERDEKRETTRENWLSQTGR